ncbi:MAG: PIN domain-containing protein [Coriobacteriales bacterium]|jgi:predicted nucleic acid-binding protein|nr:PIN domain-containing protein [Coriobacteriales bacterium]
MLDTNVVLDFMLTREPYYPDTRILMLLGYINEVELWISSAQINDLFYILTKGGKSAFNEDAKQSLKRLRQCVNVYRTGELEIDAVLDSAWLDLEDSYLYQSALSMKADYIITRNQRDFALSSIKVFDTAELLAYLREHAGTTYAEIDLATVGLYDTN